MALRRDRRRRASCRPQGHNRLRSMIETRPDWCISRQRAWGVPIAVFVDKATGELLRDPTVIERIADAFEKEGADAWYHAPARSASSATTTTPTTTSRSTTSSTSGSTPARPTPSCSSARTATCNGRPSLYLEGSDQHRGWFHSSLLESCGTRGRAPYDAVLTHGFVARRAGPQDVEVARQRASRRRTSCKPVRRRHPAPLGGRAPTTPRTCASARRS